MTILGFNDLKSWALPVGWDASELQKWAMADGTSAEEIFNTLVAGLIATAQAELEHPIFGGMISVTEELGIEYRDGSATAGMEERAEYTAADPKKSKTIGHMWPLRSYDRGLGFTMDFLRKARRTQIEANVTDTLQDVMITYERALMTRFFDDTENLLGTSGYDVPFVKGGGSVPYVPPIYRGFSFASTHTHFDRQATNAHATALSNGVKHLWEHGIMGPYVALVPFVDRSTYTALTDFRKPERAGITYADTISVAQINEEIFFGLYETELGVVLLHATGYLPTNYLGIYKSYGSNDPRNPLAVRVSPDYQFSPVAMRGEGFKQYPLENMTLIHEYGVGVRNRLNGYCCYFAASGNYTKPTIN